MADETLKDLLDALHAERVRSWEPAPFERYCEQRRELLQAANPKHWVQVGDRLPDVELEEVDGERLRPAAATDRRPTVLVFFRYAGCPACNVALPHYGRALAPALRALGARFVAVSPQIPDRLVEIKRRHALSFEVATDRDNRLGRALGILYTANAATQAASLARGAFIGETTGTGTWELPQPTVVLVDAEGLVRFVDVSPDWMARTEAAPVIAAVRAIAAVAAE